MSNSWDDVNVRAVLDHWLKDGEPITNTEGGAAAGCAPATFRARMMRLFNLYGGWLVVCPTERTIPIRDKAYKSIISYRSVEAWKPGVDMLRELVALAIREPVENQGATEDPDPNAVPDCKQ